MAADPAESALVEKLYEYGERLANATDRSQHVAEYEGILAAAKGESTKAKQLAAQLIPRFCRDFPALDVRAFDVMCDLVELEGLPVRVQAIRGFPSLGKDKEYIIKIVVILGQILMTEEIVERDAVQKALMSLVKQDVKASLEGLFKIVSGEEPVREKGPEDDAIREKTISFLKDKVFPLKAELLKPQAEMERYITDLVKRSVQDVTGAEFKFFMNFLLSLSIFSNGSPRENFQELIEIIEAQADLDTQFKVSDVDHIDRLISCMSMALPFFMRGASSSKFLNYFMKHIVPVFDKFPEERTLDFFKNIAGSSPYATAQDSRQHLPSIVQLLKKYLPGKKTEDINYNCVECLLYTFHQLAHKTPNSTNSLCGYKIVTGQPSDRLGEDFSSEYKDFTERLSATEETVRAALKKLTQGMAELNKASQAKSEEEKANIKAEQQKRTIKSRICNNILLMIKPLHAKSPTFFGEKSVTLSWMESTKEIVASSGGGKRAQAATNGPNTNAPPSKKGRGEGVTRNQLMNRAIEGLPRGGRGSGRGRGRGRGNRGRGWSYR